MSKTSNCIRLLQILSRHELLSISELANEVDTNPRNIIEYKTELEDMGYNIESIRGRYGGYIMREGTTLPSTLLSNEEIESLIKTEAYLKSKKDPVANEAFDKAISKVTQTHAASDFSIQDKVIVLSSFPLAMKAEEISKRLDIIQTAIKGKQKINVLYDGGKNTISFLFSPYQLFMLDDVWFSIGWSEISNDITFLRINRIKELEITSIAFISWAGFNIHAYLDASGLKTEWQHFVIIASEKAADAFKERVYGRNQVISPLTDNTERIEIDMKDNDRTLSFLLSLGDQIRVIEPQGIKRIIDKSAKNVLSSSKGTH